MNKNWHCKVGTHDQLIVIQNLVWSSWLKKPSLKKIKVHKNGHIFLYGLPFLIWDRHHHYVNLREQPIVDYLFLSAIEELLKNEYRNREFSKFRKYMLKDGL